MLALVRPVRLLLDPLLVAIYTAPAIAFIPILVVWFGVGSLSKVVIVFLSAVFPVMINTRTGIVEVAEPWLRAVPGLRGDADAAHRQGDPARARSRRSWPGCGSRSDARSSR